MNRVFNFIVKKPFLALLFTLLIVGVSSFGIFRLYLDNDLLHWFSKKSKIGALNYYINERFETNNPIIIMISMNEDVLTISNLIHIRNISRKGKEIEGISDVISLTEIEDIKSTSGEMIVDKLFPEDLSSITNLTQLKHYILSKESYNGSLISRDSRSTVIIFQPLANTKTDELARKVRSFVNNYINEHNIAWKVYYGGTPMLLNSITELVLKDLRFLVPLVSIVVFTVLFLSFRNIKGTILPLVTVLIATASAMGIMGYLGLPITTFGTVIPVTLIAVGNAYGIHIINEFHEKTKNNNIDFALIEVLKRTFLPILMSALTTFGGFLSIAFANEMRSARDFGIISAIGVIFSLIFTILFIPAILKLLPKGRMNFGFLTEESEHGIFSWWSKLVYKYKKWIVLFFGIISLICIYYMWKIQIKVDYLSYFDKKSEPAIVTEQINKTFDGSFDLKIYTSGDAMNPNYLRALQIIEEEIRYMAGGKTKPSSIVSVIASLNEGMTELPMIPVSSYEVENLYFFIEGNENIKKILTDDKKESLISFLLPKMESSSRYELIKKADELLKNYKKISIADRKDSKDGIINLTSKMLINRLLRAEVKEIQTEKLLSFLDKFYSEKAPNSYEEKLAYLRNVATEFYKTFKISENQISKSDLLYALSPLVWENFILPEGEIQIFERYGVGGLMKLFTDVELSLLRNQIISLAIIILIVVVLNAITFRSILEGLLSIIPILFTLLVNFGVMGFIGINMDFITITIASIAVGAGIDYTIHYLSRFTHEIRNGKNYEEAFNTTFVTTGKGIIFNSMSVGFGFAVLNFSGILPLRSFGTLMFITMLVSAFSSLTLLPAIIIYVRRILKIKGGLQ